MDFVGLISLNMDYKWKLHSFELIYCGQRLKDDRSAETYGIKQGCTVYVLPHQVDLQESESMPDHAGVSEVVTALQTALLNPAYRNIVERMLADPETIENILAATPGLDQDPVCISMLQDPELLAILAHQQNISKLLKKHPAFAQAAITIAGAVNQEGSKEGFKTTSGATYSLDQLSDDDDEPSASGGSTGGTQAITASQLAAALAAATGIHPPPTASRPSTSSGGESQMISSDFFQQAMLQAQNTATEGQLQQLRDMGIMDENRARQALQVTGGDIQAALELIFEEEM
ncbi:ubiquitin-like protein 7 isoform X2 [Gigantopelta aegis]|uniref:ubiquitin-like protein 7 isoform X2 n=1 Tax=Gigantopelta aegis TaxID=1735272 RepID=UPI001B889FF0|nr:ubiquitin-like protein 7 isoform X2 [Gigantopelta aegis]